MEYEYTIFSSNFGNKYKIIQNHWLKRVNEKCGNECFVKIISDDTLKNISFKINFEYAWWDVLRLDCILEDLKNIGKPIIHIDQDIIIEKNLKPIVDLPYDIIISTEIGENKAFPPECSKVLGFGMCSGFYILKSTSINFMANILENMKTKKYKSYSDQVNIMNYIVNNKYDLNYEDIVFGGKKYINKIISIDGIKICVLDFNIIIRDPIINDGQFANHINVDNVGGPINFINYFYNDLEKLPLTCRCGKKHLGDNNICKHIDLRNNKI